MPECNCDRLAVLLKGACELDKGFDQLGMPTDEELRLSAPERAAVASVAGNCSPAQSITVFQGSRLDEEDPDCRPYIWDLTDD